MSCFNEGKVVPPHSASHKYRVRPYTKICLYEDTWTIDDELLLLEVLEMYGMGNWKYVVSKKNVSLSHFKLTITHTQSDWKTHWASCISM